MQKSHSSPEILIIGAGPAGLMAALELDKAGKDFILAEKNGQVGGLAKTYLMREGELEFRTDNGPHRFFSKNKYLYDFVANLLKERLLLVKRQTYQFINGRYFDYPIKPLQVLRGLGIKTSLKAALDFGRAFVSYRIFNKPVANFYDYALANFGKTLAILTILDYSEKIWGRSTKELHADWARQRILGLNFLSLVKEPFIKTIFPQGAPRVKTLINHFHYPELGIGTIYEAIKSEIQDGDGKIWFRSFPTKIFHQDNRLTGAILNNNGEQKSVSFDYLIQSIHLDDFLKLLDPPPPPEILAASEKLNFRSQANLFITLDKARVSENQWIYFPERKFPFARVSEMKNFSSHMSPPGKTSLLIEFYCDVGDKIHQATKEELFNLSVPYLEKIGLIKRSEIRNSYLFRGGKDYPIYDLNYNENLSLVKNYLDKFENLFYIGRPGRFKYTNQDHSLEMGLAAAQSILTDKRIDLEHIGPEKDYLEKGAIPEKNPNN